MRVDSLFDAVENVRPLAPVGGGGCHLIGRESIGSQQTAKRINAQWVKDNSTRSYEVGQFLPEVPEYRLRELVQEAAVVTSQVHKMLNSFFGMEDHRFRPATDRQECNDLFQRPRRVVCALLRGLYRGGG